MSDEKDQAVERLQALLSVSEARLAEIDAVRGATLRDIAQARGALKKLGVSPSRARSAVALTFKQISEAIATCFDASHAAGYPAASLDALRRDTRSSLRRNGIVSFRGFKRLFAEVIAAEFEVDEHDHVLGRRNAPSNAE